MSEAQRIERAACARRVLAAGRLCQLRMAAVAEEDRTQFSESREGIVEFWGSLRATDAAVLDRTLEGLAASACPTDPRTKRQRRADALVALASGPNQPSCECGTADCPVAQAGPVGPVMIHLIGEAATVNGEGDKPGDLPGFGTVPPAMLREVAKHAKLRPMRPSELRKPEPHYRPSAALAAFIRARDLTYRFPGCDKPAEVCDIDHTVPWQLGGPTHPSNLGLLCRAHHLLKTFWCGEKGWDEKQYADGRIVWTSPSGRTYTTRPGGALFFPQLAESTGDLKLEVCRSDSTPGRALMMPARRRSRAEERAARIRWERSLNEAQWDPDPPPF